MNEKKSEPPAPGPELELELDAAFGGGAAGCGCAALAFFSAFGGDCRGADLEGFNGRFGIGNFEGGRRLIRVAPRRIVIALVDYEPSHAIVRTQQLPGPQWEGSSISIFARGHGVRLHFNGDVDEFDLVPRIGGRCGVALIAQPPSDRVHLTTGQRRG